MKKKSKLIIVLMFIMCLFLGGCIGDMKEEEKVIEEDLLGISYTDSNEEELNYETSNPVVSMYIENYGSVVMELYPEYAPNTVNNFIYLVKSGFYDNNTIHRLVKDFVLQGGDPTGSGTGGPGYSIKGEFSSNGYESNALSHTKGVLSMARSSSYDSAGSQFFIMVGDATYLDGEYAAFGKVIDGYSNIEKIIDNEKVEDESTGKLKNNLTIKKAVVDLNEYNYQEPERIEE